MRLNRVVVIVSVCIAVAALTSQAFAAEGHFERTLTVSGEADIDVLTGAGNVTLTRGSAGTVRISAHIKTNKGSDGLSPEQIVQTLESNPPIEQNGNSIRIGHVSDERLKRNVS
ncbi:MAG: hypothetical protein JO187_09425, partial [Acidobacteria bacterium]|nr:hypothetical protein [Acidobacteriota bacterium]